MHKKALFFLLFLPLFFAGALSRAANSAPRRLKSVTMPERRSGPGDKLDRLNSADRRAMLPAETVLKVLKIKPGMNIVDIGSGTGFFTFPMAEALNGTGRVFAVELDPAMTEFVAARVKKEGYKNICAATIGPGPDPFYEKRAFDIMLLSEVFHHYSWDPEEYLRRLNQSLSGAGGRLYIIHFKPAPDFSAIELGDFSGALKILKAKKSYPDILEKICGGAEEFLRTWKGGPVPEAVRGRILTNLNRLLADTGLFGGLLARRTMDSPDGWSGLAETVFAHDLELLRWLIADLDEKGVFEKAESGLAEAEKSEIRTLNRILLAGILQSDKLNFLKGSRAVYVGKRHIIKALERAGFTFVREHEGLPFHYFLEFKTGGN